MAGHLKDSALQNILQMFIVKHRKDADVSSWQDPRLLLHFNGYGFYIDPFLLRDIHLFLLYHSISDDVGSCCASTLAF